MRHSSWITIPVAALVVLASLAHADDVRIGISSGASNRMPIQCAPFAPAGDKDAKASSVQADEVLIADLTASAVFAVARPSDPIAVGAQPQAEVSGRWTVHGNEVVLSGTVLELPGRKSVLASEYKGTRTEWRALVHRFADDVVKQFTGESGIAGTRIAFVVQEGRSRELWVMDADGANAHPITQDHSLVMSPAWSPDGALLLFTSYRGGGPQLWVLPQAGGRPALVSGRRGINSSGRYSPDGQHIACSLSQDGNAEVYVLDARGGSPQRLTNSRGVGTSPAWSPTGRELAFTSDRSGTPQVHVMDASGADAHRLTYDLDYTDSPDWSPRGDRVAFVVRTGSGFDIVLARPDGGDARRVVTGGANENPHWSPDGRHLVFASNRDGTKGIYISDLDGSPPRRIDTGLRQALSPAWSPYPSQAAH